MTLAGIAGLTVQRAVDVRKSRHDPVFAGCRIDGIPDGICSFDWREQMHFANENRMQINTMARDAEHTLQTGMLAPAPKDISQ